MATGTITIETTKSKLAVLPKNLDDGSGRSTSFTDASWGDASRGYVVSAKTKLKTKSVDEIIRKAKAASKIARHGNSKSSASETYVVAEDVRANLVDVSDSEGSDGDDNNNCKSN